MAAFDSILNIDEWISDHYFTTDEGESFSKRVTARVKAVSYTHLTLPTILLV